MRHEQALGPMLGWGAHLARERMDARMAAYDVTPAQGRVLLYLCEHGGASSQQELTEFLKVKPSTANGILNRMEEKGMVQRAVSVEDGRRRLVSVTQRGRERKAQLQEAFCSTEAVMMNGLSEAECSQLLQLLQRVIGNLKEDRNG